MNDALFRKALLETKFKYWPQAMKEEAFAVLRTVRGRRLAIGWKTDKDAKAKLVNLILEAKPSIDEL